MRTPMFVCCVYPGADGHDVEPKTEQPERLHRQGLGRENHEGAIRAYAH